jgi:hypothetical protein
MTSFQLCVNLFFQEKVQITTLMYNESPDNLLNYFFFGSVHPLNYTILFKMPLNSICLFCFDHAEVEL